MEQLIEINRVKQIAMVGSKCPILTAPDRKDALASLFESSAQLDSHGMMQRTTLFHACDNKHTHWSFKKVTEYKDPK